MYQLSQLDVLEAEAIFIMREVVAEFEKPVLLFSGGKDSIVMLRVAQKAFWPARIPFVVMHVDTGHNFPEVLEYRDRRVAELGVNLVVASVQDAIDSGRRCDREAAMAKWFASEMAERVTSQALQIHGGVGYTTDLPIERYWRDARLTKIFEGTSEIQLRIISDRLMGDR